jgi:hypothetical protein
VKIRTAIGFPQNIALHAATIESRNSTSDPNPSACERTGSSRHTVIDQGQCSVSQIARGNGLKASQSYSEDKAAPGRFNDLLSKLLMSILLQPT